MTGVQAHNARLHALPVAPPPYHALIRPMVQYSSLPPHVMMHPQAIYPPAVMGADYANFVHRQPTQYRAANDHIFAASSQVTGRQPVLLYSPKDKNRLTDYQILVRKQIELFEAVQEDVDTTPQGRVRRVVLGQVGIRCRHCASLPPRDRKRGAFYYPSKLNVVYQVSCADGMGPLCFFSLDPLAPY
jgi:hypothetical protein